MKELYEKIFQPAFMNLQLGWFKENLLKDCMELENQLSTFKIKYGIQLDVKVSIPEPVEGRMYGKGIVERLDLLTTDNKEEHD